MKIKIFLFLVACSLAVSCTRKVDEVSRVTISFQQIASSNITPFVTPTPTPSASPGTSGGPNWSSEVPSTIADIGCFAVFVGGPDPILSGSYCTNAANQEFIRFGKFAGMFSKFDQPVIEVPSGPARKIYIAGVKLVSGSCENRNGGSEFTFSNYSAPYILGMAQKDLIPGNDYVNVVATANFDDAHKVQNCSFMGSGNNNGTPGGGMHFGTGYDGNMTISSTSDLSTMTYTDQSSTSRYVSSSRRLNNVASANSYNTETSFTNMDFKVGDEVMYVVTAAHDFNFDNTPVPGPDGVCGPGLFRGAYGFRQITATPSSTEMTFDLPISSAPNAVAMMASPMPSSDFCIIQVVRVPNFDSLTIDATSGAIDLTVPSYSFSTGRGGIFAMRVKSGTTFVGSNPIKFDLAGRGLAGGLPNGQGDGNERPGASAVISPNQNGGGAGGASAGGGGGANAGAGGNGGNSGGLGGGAISFCSGPCPNSEKLFFGGGGGGAGTSGGSGGGIIYFLSNSMNNSNSINVEFNSNGAAGSASASGSGGGAGGSIFAGSSGVGGTGIYQFNLNGGTGGMTTISGGGGGGGNVMLKYCPVGAPTINLSVPMGGPGSTVGASGRMDTPGCTSPSPTPAP